MNENRAPRAVFVVGTGRCGSTLISNLVRTHPTVLSLSEFFTVLGGSLALTPRVLSGEGFANLLATPGRFNSWLEPGVRVPEVLCSEPDLGSVPPLLLTPMPHLTDEPESLFGDVCDYACQRGEGPIDEHFTGLFEWLASRFERSVWVERSGGSLAYLGLLQRYWPRAKFVHIVRDGRDCANSMSKHLVFRQGLKVWNMADPDREGSPAQTLRGFGALWSAQIQSGLRILNAMPPGQFIQLRYEDICAQPRDEIARLMEFVLDEPVDESWLEQAVLQVNPSESSWRDLPAEQREALDNACAVGLRLCGYG